MSLFDGEESEEDRGGNLRDAAETAATAVTAADSAVAALAPLSIIRQETALSRYPIHTLAKGGSINIEIERKDERGATQFCWDVSYNSRFGPPGPLAYKIDTLVVNRRMEEAGRPVPKVLALGSLRDICRELGVSEGENKEGIKRALRQNASAFISAKLGYKGVDGAERRLEADFYRYSIVFTGEKLPDGRRATSVHLVLNDIYREVLDNALVRPLDYDYLKRLPPASQRFYELISYQIYAALRHGRPRAQYLYSEFCTFSPLTRSSDWNAVRPQMHRVHRPHLESGYLAKVEFENTADREGVPDWRMWYTPGPKAEAEFRAFRRRGRSPAEADAADAADVPEQPALSFPTPPLPPTPERATRSRPGRARRDASPRPAPAADGSTPGAEPGVVPAPLSGALELLRREGFDETAAHALCTAPFTGPRQKPSATPEERAERIARQCAWIARRKATGNRLGLLRRAIEQDWGEPATGEGRGEETQPRRAGRGTAPGRPPGTSGGSDASAFDPAVEVEKTRLRVEEPTVWESLVIAAEAQLPPPVRRHPDGPAYRPALEARLNSLIAERLGISA